jgi:hypothetical protein
VPVPPPEPDGTSSAEPVPYAEASHSVLTPMGQVESAGNFARGLGARRIKAFGAVVLVVCLALLALSVF